MALITISGFPVSGKTTRAAQISAYLETVLPENTAFRSVNIISDHSLGLLPAVYNESSSEKPARGMLFASLQRSMTTDSITILDSSNYIKGFRYQIYCAARELKLRTCTIHVVATPDLCREWNAMRSGESRYSNSTLENLMTRYEEPSSMARWDAPLFTILWSDENVPGPQIWEAITKGNLRPPNAGTLSISRAPTDALLILEQTTNFIVAGLVSASSNQPLGGDSVISVGESHLTIKLPPRTITLPEMQRIKRQFVNIRKKAITLGTTERGGVDFAEANVAEKFAEYIAEHVE